MAIGVGGNVFGRTNAHHQTAAGSALGAHVDQPVGGLDHVQVMLDDDDGVARVAQLVRSDGPRWGVATCAVGGGQGVAMLVERVG